MEQIVSYRSDLEWDGWDVVHYKKNDAAQFANNGAFKNGQWYKKNVYPISENGWSIPNYMGLRDDL
jgi:hypothetical protein